MFIYISGIVYVQRDGYTLSVPLEFWEFNAPVQLKLLSRFGTLLPLEGCSALSQRC